MIRLAFDVWMPAPREPIRRRGAEPYTLPRLGYGFPGVPTKSTVGADAVKPAVLVVAHGVVTTKALPPGTFCP